MFLNCSSTTTLCFFMVTPRFFGSGAVSILMFTHVPLSYLAFEAIKVSNKKLCILLAHFTQVYWSLDTFSSTIINFCCY